MDGNRRRLLQWGLTAATLAALPGCGQSARPLHMGLHVWPGYEPMLLSQSLGWLSPQQVQFRQTASATESMALLARGEIDGAGLTLDEVLRGREQGLPLSVVLVCDMSAGADMFFVRPGIKHLADLRGHRIGVEEGALGALMLSQVLTTAGLARQDVIAVPMTIDEHVNAWKTGRIDALATYEPQASRIAALGGIKLFDSRAIPELILDVVAVNARQLDGDLRPALCALTAAHLRALRFIDSNPGDAAYRLASRFQLPPERALSVFRGLVLPDLAANRRLIAGPHPVLQDRVVLLSNALQKAGILRFPATTSALIRGDFLPKEDD